MNINLDLYADDHGVTHVIVGAVTCNDAWPDHALGSPEYQFSDGPPGERGCSADYTDLLEGLTDFAGRTLIFYP